MNKVGVIPATCQPEPVKAALVDVEAARTRVAETNEQLIEAHRVATLTKRTASKILVGHGGVTQEQWDVAQAAWHTAQSDLDLVRQVHAAVESAQREAVVTLAGAVLESADSWRSDLERAWVRLDTQSAKRLQAFRAAEQERGELAAIYRWLTTVIETDAVAAIEGNPRYVFRPGATPWMTKLRAQHGGPISEAELLDALEAHLDATAMQRRLDAAATEAAEREEKRRALREQREWQLAEAQRRQEDRLRSIGADR